MPLMARGNAVQMPVPSFEQQVRSVMQDLQTSLQDVLESLPEPIRRAVDVERSLRLEKKLAWQVFRLTRSENLDEIGNVPSLGSAARVIQAARERGTSPEVLDRVTAAFERFENFATDQCGDRAGLVSLVSGLSHEKSENFELRVRKNLFRDNAHIWGLQAQTQVRTFIRKPAEMRDGAPQYESVLIAGNIGLRGLRRGEPMTISTWFGDRPGNPSDAEPGNPKSVSSAPVQIAPGFELLTDFCTSPLPETTNVPSDNGMIEMEMLIPPAGRSGAVTLYSTQTTTVHGDPRTVPPFAGVFVSVPSVEIVTELFVPAGWTDPTGARARVYARRHHPERVFAERRRDLLPQRELVSHFRPSDHVPPIEGAPEHAAAVREVMRRHGVLDQPFDLYRCRVQYPILHSLVVVRTDPAKG